MTQRLVPVTRARPRGAGAPPGVATTNPSELLRRPLRVLHVGPDSRGHGGMAAVIGGLLSSPLADRHRLDGLSTHRRGSAAIRMVVFAIALARLVAWCLEPGPRVVHVHMTVRGSVYRKAICVVTARVLGAPTLLHVHAGAAEVETFWGRLGRRRRVLLRRALAKANRVISVSRASKVALERTVGLGDVEVVVNPAPDVPPHSGRPRNADRILYLGGFANPVKGGAVLIDALASVVAALPAAEADLAGPGELPAAGRRLLDRSSSIRWLGQLDREARDSALATSEIFVLPSSSEGLPMALLEAMAHGLAIVATEVGGVPEVVTDGVDGILVPAGDPHALARALVGVLTDPARKRELGGRARARAERLTARETCDRLETIYREVALG